MYQASPLDWAVGERVKAGILQQTWGVHVLTMFSCICQLCSVVVGESLVQNNLPHMKAVSPATCLYSRGTQANTEEDGHVLTVAYFI